MSSKNNNNNDDGRRDAYPKNVAKKIASSKMYTSSGEPIRDVEAYRAAGGQVYSSNGQVIHNPVAYRNTIEASVRQNTTDPKYLWHYTDTKGAKSIAESGTIKASSTGLGGPGTYGTAKPPRCTSNNLLNNNYGVGHGRDTSLR